MNTKAKTLLASTLLTALFAGQSAIAGQDSDMTVYDALNTTESVMITNKVNYQDPSVDTEYSFENNIVSGRK